jgi:biopolymer transport protein ExbD
VAGGGSSEQSSGDDPELVEQGTFVDINITPLVDIFLVLLTILMASSTVILDANQAASEGEGAGFKVQLPSGSKDEDLAAGGNELVVAVPDDGTIILRGEVVTLVELEKALQEAAAGDPNKLVLVQADERAVHKRVVEVMEAARRAGLKNLAIATRPAP